MPAEDLKPIAADGTRLHACRWVSRRADARDLVLVHGGFEHIGRYDWVAARLNDAGYHVIGVDLRGHGHSAGRRGHVEAFSDYTADLRAAIALTATRPLAVLAHSLGALIALEAVREGLPEVDCLALVSPFLGLPDVPAWKRLAARLCSTALPLLPIKSGTDLDSICTDRAVVAAYRQDPLIFDTLSARCAREIMRTQTCVMAAAPDYRIPLYLARGTAERVVSSGAVQRFAAHGGPNLTLREWPGRYHELLNEPNRAEILDDLIAWLGEICPDRVASAEGRPVQSL